MFNESILKRFHTLIFGMAMAAIAAAPAHSTILFRPIGNPPEVFSYGGNQMSAPLINAWALSSPKVYFIFVGPKWKKNGAPSGPLLDMIKGAKAILDSSYLSGLKQYYSDGLAVYGGYTIDTSIDPTIHPTNLMYSETDKILSEPDFSSWSSEVKNFAGQSPIFVVVRYQSNATNDPGGYGGSNDCGPNQYTSGAYNAIDVAIASADQVDEFTWVLSHELVERISTGTGSLIGVGSSAGNQIADGEPENAFYAYRLPGTDGPLVTSYWSFIDQAWIIPDGKPDRKLLVPVWNNHYWTGNFVSQQQGDLYLITGYNQQGSTQFVNTTTKIDTNVQSFVVNLTGGTATIYDLTADGTVQQYSGAGTTWFSITDSHTVASTLVGTTYLNNGGAKGAYKIWDGQLYILASTDHGSNQVRQYSGAGTNWNLVEGDKTVKSIASAGGILYLEIGPSRDTQTPWIQSIIDHSGSLSRSAISDSSTKLVSMASAGGELYIIANDGPTRGPQVLHFDRALAKWEVVSPSGLPATKIVAAGDVLCMLASNSQVYQYGLTADSWFSLVGTNTVVTQLLVQDGNQLLTVAAKDGGPAQVWQYNGPADWSDLTKKSMHVLSASIGSDNRIYVVASNDGGRTTPKWIYNGTPGDWSIVK
jgi:hypothetical protein